MIEAFQKRWGNHSSFKSHGNAVDRSGFPTFTINHFNGAVTYSAESFLERNLDAINPDFVSLLRGGSDGNNSSAGLAGGEGMGSINPFVKGLFSNKAIATQAHPRNEDTIVSAQQAVKPMRAPSTRRKAISKRMQLLGNVPDIEERDDEDGSGGGGGGGGLLSPNNPSSTAAAAQSQFTSSSPCVGGEFRAALDTLFDTFEETQTWYVFCINPNDSQLPNQLEGRSVKGQVRSIGLSEVARRCVVVMQVGMTPEEFCERYKEGLDMVGVSEGDERERAMQARTAFGLGDKDLVLGQHKVMVWILSERFKVIDGRFLGVFIAESIPFVRRPVEVEGCRGTETE
jgi:chitin synthase